MIDTANKRSSVFEVPGLTLCPFPSGATDASDRQYLSDVYIGVPAHVSNPGANQTLWVDSLTSGSSWRNLQRNTSAWVSSQTNASSWKKSVQTSSGWVK